MLHFSPFLLILVTGSFDIVCSQICQSSFIPERACKMSVYIRSEGAQDPNRTTSTGSSYLVVGGKDYSKKANGINVAVFKQQTGEHVKSDVFDVKAGSANGDKLRDFITALPNDVIILMAIQTSGNANNFLSSANAALKSIGVNDTNIADQESFAAIACKETGEFCKVKQSINRAGQGPSYTSALLQLKFPFHLLNGPCEKGNSYRRGFSNGIENHAIEGPLLSTITANNIDACKDACFFHVDDLCYMLNYISVSKKCQLFYEKRVSDYKVVQKSGLTLMTRECSENPCKNGGHCYSLGDVSHTACICRSEFSGNFCENVSP